MLLLFTGPLPKGQGCGGTAPLLRLPWGKPELFCWICFQEGLLEILFYNALLSMAFGGKG